MRVLKTYAVVATTLAALCLVGCSSSEPPIGNSPTEAIADYLDRLAALGFSGQVLVAEGDRVLLDAAYGFADRDAGTRLSPDEPLAIASLSKQFTAAAVLLLVDQGKFDLEDKLGRHFPEAPRDKRDITIHQLLTHTGGFRRDAFRSEEVPTRDGLVERVLAKPLRDGPQTEYSYSNSGYQLLAALVEQVSGTSFDSFLRAEFFEPLGMERTGPIHSTDGSSSPVRAYNEWTAVGTWTDWPRGWKHRGSGGQVSTAGDLFRWWRALKTGSVFSDSLVARMFTPHAEIREHTFYGYGWEIRKDSAKGDLVLHGGDNQGFHSELRWRATGDRLVVVLTHLNLYDESGWWLGLHKRRMASNLLNMLAGEATSRLPQVARLGPGALAAYCGTYLLAPDDRMEIWAAGDTLWLGARGQEAVESLLPADPTEIARRSALNVRSRSILESVSRNEPAALGALLKPGEIEFFADSLRTEWLEFESEHGPFKSMELVGSIPLPWDPDLVRTQIDLVFGSKRLDYHLTWNGDDLYETISEVGRPYPYIVPLASVGGGALASFDHVTEHSVRIEFDTPKDDLFETLTIGDRVARRMR